MINRFATFSFAFIAISMWAPLNAANDILFVGNSFTHGQYAPLQTYNNTNVLDENNSGRSGGYGGVPGVFQKMAAGLGYTCTVHIEAVSSQNLDYHYTLKSSIIGQAKWKYVILQDYSTEPCPTAASSNPAGFTLAQFNTSVTQLKTLILGANPSAKILLYETWARPGLCSMPGGQGGPYTGVAPVYGMPKMLNELRTNYYSAYANNNLTGVGPVGDAFALAISLGYAHANVFDGTYNSTTGKFNDGTFSLWYFNTSPSSPEAYHESVYGGYLAAAVFIAKITGLDPRNIPTGTNSAAAGLGISSTDAGFMNSVAYQATTNVLGIANGPPPSSAMTNTAYSFTYSSVGFPTPTFSRIAGSLPPGLTLTTGGILSGTPTTSGTFTGTIQAINGAQPIPTQNFSITVVSPLTYNQWATNNGVGETSATPQNDGVSNLQKFVADINPTVPMTAADRAALPTIGTAGGGTQLTLTYRVNKLATGITITPQTSTDLQTWTTVGTVSQISTDGTTGDPIYMATTNITSTKQFIRLKVSMP